MRLISSPSLKKEQFVLPIEKGGTGQTSLSAGAAALGLLTKGEGAGYAKPAILGEKLIGGEDLAGGLNNGQVPIVNGPDAGSIGETLLYRIQNFDSFTAYDVSGVNGTVSRDNEQIIFQGLEAGDAYVVVNGTRKTIRIGSGYVAAPVIDLASSVIKRDRVTLVTEPYLAIGDQTNIHLRTDWQIASDASFATIVAQSMDDEEHLTSWTGMDLSPNTTYYARVRHTGSVSGVSAWSLTQGFKTRAEFQGVLVQELTVSAPNDSIFGHSVSLSDDESTLAVGAPGANGSKGGGFIFHRAETGEYELAFSTLYTESTYNPRYGRAVWLSADGNTAVMTAPARNNWTGFFDVFTRVGGSWTLLQTVSSPRSAPAYFGIGAVISEDGQTIVIGSSYREYVYVYERGQNGLFALQQEIYKPWTSDYHFGRTVRLSRDKSTLLIASETLYRVSVYKKQNGGYVKITDLTSTNADEHCFGIVFDLSDDGGVIAVGGPYYSTYRGYVKIFKGDGSNYTQTAIVYNPDNAANSQFGAVIALTGDGKQLAVGAPTYASNTGRVYYLRELEDESWELKKTIQAPYAGPISFSGSRVDNYIADSAMAFTKDGERLVVGSGKYQTKGGVFVYE